jgi:hypothetical protein
MQRFGSKLQRGAEATGANCKLIHLIDLQFNPILQYGYRKRMELEPDLISIQQKHHRLRPFSVCLPYLVGNLSCSFQRIYRQNFSSWI